MSADHGEPSLHFIVVTGAVVAAATRQVENGGAKADRDWFTRRRAAFKADRDWFKRHRTRRYRLRPLLILEMPIETATHMLVVRKSRRIHRRIALLLLEGEPVPCTDREIAAMLNIETII